MIAFTRAFAGGVLGLGALWFALPAVAGPTLPQIGLSARDIVKVKTVCDYRGCFGFGEQQWHRRSYVQPNFRPPTATAPTYVRPDAAGRPRTYYAPATPTAPRRAPVAGTGHVEWCRNQYRSYNPSTDRFVTYEGTYKTCNSPYR